MTQYLSLTESISINKNTAGYKIPFLLYNCKPLMPKNPIIRIKVVIKYFKSYISTSADVKSLPINGDIAIKIGEQNYKIICLKENLIYTFFDKKEKNDMNIFRIRKYKQTSKSYEEILNINKKDRVIKGVFYNGHHPIISNRNRAADQMLTNLFSELVIKSNVREQDHSKYVNTLGQECIKLLERNFHKVQEEDYIFVKIYVEDLTRKIINSRSMDRIKLTLSHGDLKQDNLIELNNKFVPIDWEFCDFRSPTYDIYKFKSRFPNYDQEFYKHVFRNIRKKVEACGNGLDSYFRENENSYLHLFHLEDIHLRLSQFESRHFASDFSTHLVKAIKRFETISDKEG